ncbi:MAG TPA: class I SAM-dependent methyltransferase [Pyrinomonadaceae bacterium]|jgi:ubiquinone/menaquinone biosynthesis C-methylase UbiE|nr:class I SAM-dependent methyltransferase [Pyrinomonadaceae bacterium]
MSKPIEAFNGYNDYIAYEWKYFTETPDRAQATLEATKEVEVRRVLDIGCGAGQEMLPFVERGATGVGMDITPEVGKVGRKMYGEAGFAEKVSFLRASGNELPFESESFDVLICRGALMFMESKRALGEMARVLRPNGAFLLKVQDAPYYWWKVGHGLKTGSVLTSIHAARVLAAGNWYLMTGKQSFGKLTAGGEIFQSRQTLNRELQPYGMRITGEMPDTNRQTPSFVIRKNGSN